MTNKIRTILAIIALFHTALPASAQVVNSSDSTRPKPQTRAVLLKPKGPKSLTSEISGGLRLNSNGWSLYTDFGKIKSKDKKQSDMFHNVRVLQVEFTEKKDPKEHKSTSITGTGSGTNKYIYGKINNFYGLKLGIGYRKMIAGKPDPGTVSIHWLNLIGASVGLLKPYYLNVVSTPAAIKYKDPVKGDFLSQELIVENAGFGKGLNEISVVPGGHFKSAIHFDFAPDKKNVIGVETGFNIEYYSTGIPLMAGLTPKPYFADIFIAVQFGKRW